MDKHKFLQSSQTDSEFDIGIEPETIGPSHKNETLSHKETRKIVTPYAFFVADDLLGTPLAGPFRRGFGMLIDLFCIALLTQISSLVLAAIAAWTFFKAGNRLKTKKRFKKLFERATERTGISDRSSTPEADTRTKKCV